MNLSMSPMLWLVSSKLKSSKSPVGMLVPKNLRGRGGDKGLWALSGVYIECCALLASLYRCSRATTRAPTCEATSMASARMYHHCSTRNSPPTRRNTGAPAEAPPKNVSFTKYLCGTKPGSQNGECWSRFASSWCGCLGGASTRPPYLLVRMCLRLGYSGLHFDWCTVAQAAVLAEGLQSQQEQHVMTVKTLCLHAATDCSMLQVDVCCFHHRHHHYCYHCLAYWPSM